jgi:two-component system LytT family response regulator
VVIQAIVADDEVLARQKLRTLVHDDPQLQIVAEASSPSEILEQVRAKAPHLLFLDISLPAKNGFDVITELSQSKEVSLPLIIITTAHDQYALRAFEMHAVDYLLKPFTAERFHEAIQHARERIERGPTQASPNSRQNGSGKPLPSRIVFKSRGRILFLPVSEIVWIAAEENYVRICTATDSHLLRETMTNLEEKLDPQMFLRVHRSAIVNVRYLKEVRRVTQGDFVAVLSNGQKVAMSRNYHSRIEELIANG